MFSAMKLASYLLQEEISDSAFAERIGVSRQALWRYKSGDRRPEWDVLERIAHETSGQVTPNDFLDVARDEPSNTEIAPSSLGAAAVRETATEQAA